MTDVRTTKEVLLVAHTEEDPPVRMTKAVVLVAYDPQSVEPPVTSRFIQPILFGW